MNNPFWECITPCCAPTRWEKETGPRLGPSKQSCGAGVEPLQKATEGLQRKKAKSAPNGVLEALSIIPCRCSWLFQGCRG